jgi:manganese transport protein
MPANKLKFFSIPKIGPAVLVTAAFIGPGSVITATLAGANFGFALLWALVFSVLATIILQEMAARLGVVTQQGLGENIQQSLQHPLLKFGAILLVVSAIVVGNSAYQGGNIAGASLGLASLLTQLVLSATRMQTVLPIIIGTFAFLLLLSGSYKVIEKVLMLLVALMSLAFISTFILIKPDLVALFAGMFIPHIPDGATLTVIALIGTTVVPYNLFLHASSAKQKWHSAEQLPAARKDLYVAIPLGGLISLTIVATAATAFFGKQISIQSAADLAPALQPVFGDWAAIFMAVGLFAAGISSAVTAPLAAAFALSGILNFNQNSTAQMSSKSFKVIWLTILVIGTVVASSGYKPINIIWFAQVTNGLLLPIVTVFLLWIMNNERLGQYKNTLWQNSFGALVLLVTLLLSARSLLAAFGGLS